MRKILSGVRAFVLLLPVWAGALGGCARQDNQPPPPGPTVVAVSQPLEQEVTDYAGFTGRTAAVENVDIRARVGGYLTEIAFQPGQEVKQGQLLFQIEPAVYQAALDRALADVEQYTAQLRLTEEEHERNRRLLRSGAVAREDVERIQAQRDQAAANLAGARASVRTARENLGWTKVTAPIDG